MGPGGPIHATPPGPPFCGGKGQNGYSRAEGQQFHSIVPTILFPHCLCTPPPFLTTPLSEKHSVLFLQYFVQFCPFLIPSLVRTTPGIVSVKLWNFSVVEGGGHNVLLKPHSNAYSWKSPPAHLLSLYGGPCPPPSPSQVWRQQGGKITAGRNQGQCHRVQGPLQGQCAISSSPTRQLAKGKEGIGR